MTTEIENVISVKDLKTILSKHADNDLVCIRHCDGTDFPPFICIQDKQSFNNDEDSCEFICLSNY